MIPADTSCMFRIVIDNTVLRIFYKLRVHVVVLKCTYVLNSFILA
jgi:hypothetical protein